MNPEGGDRMKDVDPEFARLVSALRKGGPSPDALARAIGAVETGAKVSGPASRPAKSPSRLPWIGVGTVVLVLSATGYEWSRHDPSGGVATVPATAPRATRTSSETAAEGPTSTVRVEDLPLAQAAPPEPIASAIPPRAQASTKAPSIAARPATTEQAPSADAFRDELTLVEQIRTQLSRGETAACLRSIDQYGERFRGGAFVQEVEVMRIEALATLATPADGERARTFGRRFLSQYPTSPYAERVRSVLDKTK